MKKNIKAIVAIGIAVAAVAVILVVLLKTAGGNVDVVGKESITSFENVLNTIPDNVKADEDGAMSRKSTS